MTVAYEAYQQYLAAGRRYPGSWRAELIQAREMAATAWTLPLAEQVFHNADAGVRRVISEGFSAFRALRMPCVRPDSPQYKEDMQLLCDAEMTASDVRTLIKWTGTDVDQWFGAAVDEDLVCTREDGFKHRDDISYCEFYDEYCEDTEEVHVSRRNTERWCEDARDENAFFCDISQHWYSDRNFSSAETCDGQTICTEVASDYDYFYSEQQGGYTDVYDEDEDDEDSEDSSIPSYHSATRCWSYAIANQSTRAFYGFELEVDFEDYDARHSCYHDDLQRGSDYTAERDGSLNDATGLEVITRPVAIDELRTPDNFVQQLLEILEEGGAADGGSRYGVHITCNWQRLTPHHCKRVKDFICDTQSMTEFVARRQGTTYCKYDKHSHEKHTATYTRPTGAVEVRVFRSTVDYDVLMSYVDYLEAATEWTREVYRVTTGVVAQALFRVWVRSHPEKYPYLCARLPRLTSKDAIQCVSQSLNPPVESSVKTACVSASRTTLTEPDSRIGLETYRLVEAPNGNTYYTVIRDTFTSVV